MLAFLCFVMLCRPAAGPRQTAQTADGARPCASSWNKPPVESKKASKKRKDATEPSPGSCVEVALPALEIQEFLESFARQQQWRISDERMGEDWWTFSRDLNRDELLQATKKTPDREKVDWKSGTSMIRMSTLHLEDGYTRTVIRATFRGYGLSEDRFAMQRDYWELETSGSLEEGLISALKAHLQSKH